MSGADLGSYNRRLRFESREDADPTDIMSAGKAGWATVATVWASKQDTLPSRAEKLQDGVSMAQRPARVRTAYRADLMIGGMRVAMGSLNEPDSPRPADRRYFEVVSGPAEIGNRDEIEFMIVEFSTQGNAP